MATEQELEELYRSIENQNAGIPPLPPPQSAAPIGYDEPAGIATPPIPYDAPSPAATIRTEPTGTGSAIGTTGGYDPETGDRYTSQFRYNPVQQGGGQGGGYDDLMRQAYEQSMAFLNPAPAPHGNTPYWENPNTYYPHQAPIDPVEQAKTASAMAYKYIGMRGYQQALKDGKSAAEAFAQWGPLVVGDAHFGNALKVLQPKPNYTYDQAHNMWTTTGGGAPVKGNPVVGAPRLIPAANGQPAYLVDPVTGRAQFFPTPAPHKQILAPADESALKEATRNKNLFYTKLTNPSTSDDDATEARRQILEATKEINRISKNYSLPTSSYDAVTKVPKEDFAAKLAASNAPIVAQASIASVPLPKTKSELVTGRKYITSKGEATWDGSKFVK